MGKHFSWMLAAILTCGLVLTTSCRKEVVPEKLEGLWYNQFVSTIYPGEYKDIIHTVLEFREDGVLIERSYHSYVDSRGDHLDRDRRHDLYTVNPTFHVVYFNTFAEQDSPVVYKIEDGTLSLSYTFGIETFTRNYVRPTQSELEMFDTYDTTIPSDDYVGVWFRSSESNQLYNYVLCEFTEDGEFHMLRYAYDKSKDMCRRREYRMAYSDLGIVDGKQSLKVFTEDRPDAYSLFNWTVTDNILSLIEPEYEDVSNDFHPLTLDDLILMEELDEKCE